MAVLTVSGHLKNSSGAAIANAPVNFLLVNYGGNLPVITGTNILVPLTLTLTTDTNGFFTGSVQGNDTITPANTFYQVTYDNTITASYTLTGANANLDSLSPLTVIPVPTGAVTANLLTSNNTFTGTNIFTGPLQNTGTDSGTQTISGAKTYIGAVMFDGSISDVGSVSIAQIGTPAAPVVTVNGVVGTTSYTYFCVAKDGLNNQTLPSVGTTITNGNATLSATNFNTVSCGGQTGAVSYIILKTNTSIQLGTCTTTSGAVCIVSDTGQATSAYTAQISDQTGTFKTTGPGTHTGTETFNGNISGTLGNPSSTAFTPTAAFTATQMNNPFSILFGGVSPLTEFQSEQGGTHFSTDAFTVGHTVPSTSSIFQSSGFAVYTNTSSTTTNVPAGYFSCRVLANNGKCWSLNPVVLDAAGLTTGIQLNAEFDFNFNNPTTAYSGGGLQINLFGSSASNIYPVNALSLNSTLGQWQGGLFINRAVIPSTNAAINILPAGTATATASFQPPSIQQRSSYWTGTAAADDVWTFQPSLGTGANPFVNYQITHTGSTNSSINYGPQFPVRLAIFGSNGQASIFALDNSAPASSSTITVPTATNATMSLTIASGTATMTTAAIAAGACGTTVTVAAAGVLATDTITVAFNAAPAGTNAGLVQWPTAGNVNFAYCPGVAETPAAATINWRVVR